MEAVAGAYSLKTVALSEQQPRRLAVCGNNWIIVERRMKDLGEES